jgi:prepilin-type N-terminal cleavage/methylation domain-containing protein
MSIPRRHPNLAGFTLIELVLSAALMAIIMVSSYLCLNAAVASQKTIGPRVDIFQNARVAMAIMTADLRGACPLAKEFQFLGMHRMLGEVEADNLDFATHHYTPRRPREGDFCEVSFYLDKNPNSGQYSLWRRRNPTIAPDPLSGGSREEIAQGLLGLRFEFYDGLEWYDTWGEVKGRGKEQNSLRVQGNLSGMPDAVRITLGFDANPHPVKTAAVSEVSTPQAATEPPMVFQTVVQLNLAASSRRSSAGSSPINDTAGPTAPGAGSGGGN